MFDRSIVGHALSPHALSAIPVRLVLLAVIACAAWAVVIVAVDRASLGGLDLDLLGEPLAGAVWSWPAAWSRYRDDLTGRRRRTDKTAASYRRPLWAFYGPNGYLERKRRSVAWQKARENDLVRWLAEPRPHTRSGLLAPKSVELYVTAARSFSAWAVDVGQLRRDPFARITVPSCEAAIPRAIPWDDTPDGTGMATLLSWCGTDPRLRLAVLLGLRGGLRISEIAGLRIENLILRGDRPKLYVRGKGGKERAVDLHPWLLAELRAQLAQRPTRGPVIDNADHPGRPVTGEHVGRLIGRAMHALGTVNDAGAQASPHGLRHTFAHDLARVGGGRNERAIGIALGHAPGSKVTRLYTAGYRDDLNRDINALHGPEGPGAGPAAIASPPRSAGSRPGTAQDDTLVYDATRAD